MQQGEFTLERLLKAFNQDGPGAGWNCSDIQRAIGTASRACCWTAIPLAVVAAGAILAACPPAVLLRGIRDAGHRQASRSR
jgi:hypothetical protein